VIHLEHSFVWCWNLDTSEGKSEIPGMFEIWCLRRMKKIILTDHVRKEVLHSHGGLP
jgi:hypothetical protein